MGQPVFKKRRGQTITFVRCRLWPLGSHPRSGSPANGHLPLHLARTTPGRQTTVHDAPTDPARRFGFWATRDRLVFHFFLLPLLLLCVFAWIGRPYPGLCVSSLPWWLFTVGMTWHSFSKKTEKDPHEISPKAKWVFATMYFTDNSLEYLVVYYVEPGGMGQDTDTSKDRHYESVN